MRIISTARLFMLISIMVLPACGVKVGVDDETINAIECAFNKDCSSSNSEDSTATDDPTEETDDRSDDEASPATAGSGGSVASNAPTGEADDTSDGAGQENATSGDAATGETSADVFNPVSYQGTSETNQESNGGIDVIEPRGYNPSSGRAFLGTFKHEYYYYGTCFSRYNFPAIVRAYSHQSDPFIDFETSAHELAWVAELFQDGTFDFSVMFLDKFAHPSVAVDCTCAMVEGYEPYYPDKIACTCAGDDGMCSLNYEMM